MKKNWVIIISAIIIFCMVCLDLFCTNLMLDIKFKLIVYIFVSALVFIDMKIKNKKETDENQKEKNRKKALIIIFIIYTILIMSLLLFDNSYRRFGMWDNINLFSKEHFEFYSNFIPFKTIYDFVQRTIQGNINTNIVFTNIVGNIVVFAPYGLFIPMIFKDKFSNLKNFTLLMVGIVFIVECVQFITMKGAFDIDDLILNVFGAIIVFGLMKVKKIRMFVEGILK